MTGPSAGGTSAGGSAETPEFQILTAREVSVPFAVTRQPEVSPEVLRIRSDFLAGKDLPREDIERLIASAEPRPDGTPTNGNCGVC
jgi:hypothetical protein